MGELFEKSEHADACHKASERDLARISRRGTAGPKSEYVSSFLHSDPAVLVGLLDKLDLKALEKTLVMRSRRKKYTKKTKKKRHNESRKALPSSLRTLQGNIGGSVKAQTRSLPDALNLFRCDGH